MHKNFKKMFGFCLAIPLIFSINGCGKDDDPKIEKWDGTIAEVSVSWN